MAVALADGSSLVYNPTAGLPEAGFAELERRVGRPSVLLVPNQFHGTGVRPWSARYPAAELLASTKACRRLERKWKLPFEPVDALGPRLAETCALLHPPGTRNGEVWLRFEADRRWWVVGDAWCHFGRIPRGPVGWIARVLGIGSEPVVHRAWRFVLEDARAYRAWTLERLADEPDVVLPMHGLPIEGRGVLRDCLLRGLGRRGG